MTKAEKDKLVALIAEEYKNATLSKKSDRICLHGRCNEYIYPCLSVLHE